MEQHIKTLLEYFKEELLGLDDSYSWPIPNIQGFDFSQVRSYAANVALKHFFHEKWHAADISGRKRLARVIVVDWGQVKGNLDETLDRHAEDAQRINPNLPLEGVASYSKILSIVNYNRYAIYDARVAACLNAIQVNRGEKKPGEIIPAQGLAFHYVPGRNNITGNTVKKCGFSQEKSFKRAVLVESGWQSMKRDECYRIYLDTLKTCLQHLREEDQRYNCFKLYDLEMVLFSNAEKECLEALNNLQTLQTTVE